MKGVVFLAVFLLGIAAGRSGTIAHHARKPPSIDRIFDEIEFELPDVGLYCNLCTQIMDSVYVDVIANNATDQDILKALDKVCDQLPFAKKEACKVAAQGIVKAVEYLQITIIDFYTPYDLCTMLSLCTVDCCLMPSTPEQIRISLSGVPNEIVVSWTTLNPSPSPVVYYGLSSNSMTLLSKNYTTTTYKNGGWKGEIHYVVLTGLEPGATYYYRCGDLSTGIFMEPNYFYFTNPPANISSFSIACFGDMGATDASDGTVYQLSKLAQNGNFSFILHAGDISYANGVETVWDNFLRKIEPIGAYVPYMTAPGNHEIFYNFTSYRHRFGMPGYVTGSGDGNDLYYSFNYGKVHFLIYDLEKDYGYSPDTKVGAKQWDWIEQDLINANQNRDQQPVIVAVGHRPFYCSDKESGGSFNCDFMAKIYRERLESLWYNYSVNLVISAHMHNYERMYPVYNLTVGQTNYNNPRDPVYIVTGAAGCKEGLDSSFTPEPYSAIRIVDTGFGVLTYLPNGNLEWKFLRSSDLEVLDSIVITL